MYKKILIDIIFKKVKIKN